MINLTCPSCQVELEIDDGFRGGVCRCFDCGTLMTVPDTSDTGSAESLSRPESPEALVSPAGGREEFEKTGEFFTSSGKRVHLTRRDLRHVPVARKKRMGVRIAVVSVMAVIAVGMVASVIVGIVLLVGEPEEPGAAAGIRAIGYDPDRNPYLLSEANFMSATIPPGMSVVLMTDGSQAMSRYLDYVKQSMWSAIVRMDIDQSVQLVLWRDSGPLVLPSAPTAVKQLPRAVVLERLREALPGGGLSAKPAFDRVMGGLPPQVVYLALSRTPPVAELEYFRERLDDADTRLVVIHIDAIESDPVLERIAKDSGGSYMIVPGGQLQRWYSAYLAGGGQMLNEIAAEGPDDAAR